MDQSSPDLRHQRFTELDPVVAYRLWALRSEVFVVEQEAAYLDLDGRDVEPGTWHFWCADELGMPVATLRVLDDDEVWRVGRVATASGHRGSGLAAAMVRGVLALCSDRAIVLDAQAHLRDWYAAFGFVATGAEYADEDGIPHVPMRREVSGT
ncbi:putative acyltransferase [Janibacter sp. HTCC2649]|uniref:GNAT family N-acetyltransferase n=1 Tax=Janibacter sp. HTCC2649 TaxID=313589 RepID=UPI000066E9C7|nr:GNAT family N-acetyltransferase [Janibacter sp. HTCC2649]EAP99543.1 putative acyltransferase [Janibacter sp. HTCC2649]